MEESPFNNKSTVYGPVKSWRFGQSLGIDPIFVNSTCSFNCVYCQLGQIQDITNDFKIYVETETVIRDYKEFLKNDSPLDIITFSGSGEPTLAENLGEIANEIKKLSPKTPLLTLTNATHLHLEKVQENLKLMDIVTVKIDAANQEMFEKVNRPAPGNKLDNIIEAIINFKRKFNGKLEIQTMLMPMNKSQINDLAEIYKRISPDLVQLNTPKRPYPTGWHKENRGNHLGIHDHPITKLKVIDPLEAEEIESALKAQTGLEFISIYRK